MLTTKHTEMLCVHTEENNVFSPNLINKTFQLMLHFFVPAELGTLSNIPLPA